MNVVDIHNERKGVYGWGTCRIFAEARGILERTAGESRVAILLSLLGRPVRVHVLAASVGAV